MSTELRRARATDRDHLVPFLIRGRAHLSGSRRPVVLRAFLADSLGPSPRTTVVVAHQDGVLAAALLAVNGDRTGYYRELARRHPLAGAALLAHRLRRAPYRILARRQLRRRAPAGDVPHPLAVDVLADEPRLRQPAPGPGDPGPRATDEGPDVAYCLYVLVDRDHRGTGLGRAILEASVRHLRAVGAARYDCSFDPRDIAAAKLYLSMPFEIRRYPAGYFASLDLAPIPPEELPR